MTGRWAGALMGGKPQRWQPSLCLVPLQPGAGPRRSAWSCREDRPSKAEANISGIWKQERLDDCVTVRTFSRSRPTPGLTYFPLLGGMCDHVMPSWSSIARSRLVRVAVHPDAHFRCLGSRSRMAGRPPTLWAAGPHRQSTDHFQCLGQGTAPSHLAQNVQAHEGRSLRGASVQCHDEGECEARPSSSYHSF